MRTLIHRNAKDNNSSANRLCFSLNFLLVQLWSHKRTDFWISLQHWLFVSYRCLGTRQAVTLATVSVDCIATTTLSQHYLFICSARFAPTSWSTLRRPWLCIVLPWYRRFSWQRHSPWWSPSFCAKERSSTLVTSDRLAAGGTASTCAIPLTTDCRSVLPWQPWHAFYT